MAGLANLSSVSPGGEGNFMNLMGTPAKVAIGVAVAQAVGGMMQRSGGR